MMKLMKKLSCKAQKKKAMEEAERQEQDARKYRGMVFENDVEGHVRENIVPKREFDSLKLTNPNEAPKRDEMIETTIDTDEEDITFDDHGKDSNKNSFKHMDEPFSAAETILFTNEIDDIPGNANVIYENSDNMAEQGVEVIGVDAANEVMFDIEKSSNDKKAVKIEVRNETKAQDDCEEISSKTSEAKNIHYDEMSEEKSPIIHQLDEENPCQGVDVPVLIEKFEGSQQNQNDIDQRKDEVVGSVPVDIPPSEEEHNGYSIEECKNTKYEKNDDDKHTDDLVNSVQDDSCPTEKEGNDEKESSILLDSTNEVSLVTCEENIVFEESSSVGDTLSYVDTISSSGGINKRRVSKKRRPFLPLEFGKEQEETIPTNDDIDNALRTNNWKTVDLEDTVNTALARYLREEKNSYSKTVLPKYINDDSIVYKSIQEFHASTREYWSATLKCCGERFDPSRRESSTPKTSNESFDWGRSGFYYDCGELVGCRMGKVVYRSKEVAKDALMLYILKEVDPKGKWLHDIMEENETTCLLRKQDVTNRSSARWAVAIIRKKGYVYLVDIKDTGSYRKPVFLCLHTRKKLLKNMVLTLNAMKKSGL